VRIAICHTQLQVLGGGERVALTIASELAKRGHSVILYGITNYNKSFFEEYYGIDLSTVKFVTSFGLLSLFKPFRHYRRCIIPYMLSKTRDFDLIIDTSSNGFYPIRTGTKSVCYIHYPFGKLPKSPIAKLSLLPIWNRIGYAFDCYDKLICNSLFTKNEINKLTSQDVTVIYPPVGVCNDPICHTKEKLICTVGRFSPEKNMEVMIASFREVYTTNPDWKLAIVGSSTSTNYLQMLKDLCKDLPVEFHCNAPHSTLCEIYSRASIYWHAKGFDVNEKGAYEHFGITTAEAMSHGCIPVVINKGGQCEIVDYGENGFRWDTPDEMIYHTNCIIADRDDQTTTLRNNAINKSKQYTEDIFRIQIALIVEDMMHESN